MSNIANIIKMALNPSVTMTAEGDGVKIRTTNVLGEQNLVGEYPQDLFLYRSVVNDAQGNLLGSRILITTVDIERKYDGQMSISHIPANEVRLFVAYDLHQRVVRTYDSLRYDDAFTVNTQYWDDLSHLMVQNFSSGFFNDLVKP